MDFAVNLTDVVSGIRERVIRRTGNNDPVFLPLRNELAKLRSEYEQLYELRHLVGRMPAQPATLRAKVGAPLVRVVQRMLFWYTPQIREVADASATFAGTACTAMEQQADLTAALAKRIEELEATVAELRQARTHE
jgi:hypothetical protein